MYGIAQQYWEQGQYQWCPFQDWCSLRGDYWVCDWKAEECDL